MTARCLENYNFVRRRAVLSRRETCVLVLISREGTTCSSSEAAQQRGPSLEPASQLRNLLLQMRQKIGMDGSWPVSRSKRNTVLLSNTSKGIPNQELPGHNQRSSSFRRDFRARYSRDSTAFGVVSRIAAASARLCSSHSQRTI